MFVKLTRGGGIISSRYS